MSGSATRLGGAADQVADAEISIAEVLDVVVNEIREVSARGLTPSSLHLSLGLYNAVAEAKSRELDRGEPLLLLGLPVVPDDSVTSIIPELH